ncbi:MAG: CDGSH iron-sulfur domain-containing protein [Proteobacteria bacterium]|nr:CDGSH iron-sulfur domain-containing protein [Pseudomonadota bacterium]
MADCPLIASRKGFYHELKAGRRYAWCSCGRSKRQPFCDGAHQGTGFEPVIFTAERDEEVIFCGCKHSGTAPFCDGAHNNLPGGYAEDDPDSAANQAIAAVTADPGGRAMLDGGLCVVAPGGVAPRAAGSLTWRALVTPAHGARFQSCFHLTCAPGTSPVVAAGGRHSVLYCLDGEGSVTISGRPFAARAQTGLYVMPDEAFAIAADRPMTFYLWQGPGGEALDLLDAMPGNFDASHPDRAEEIAPDQRQAMAARYFQLLVDARHGSTVMTQFQGNIPLSKAEPHRHLYEEILVVLDGQGMVWGEALKTPIGPGDVLFLPAKAVHSLQCLSPEGLNLVGVIYPGNNPAINY